MRKVMPDTGNLASYLVLMRSWVLEKNLQSLVY